MVTVNPRTERRLMLLVIVTLLAVNLLVLALAPGDSPAPGDVREDQGEEEGAARGDGLGEPDEVVEGFESGPAGEGK
jgi:hypothetical protein